MYRSYNGERYLRESLDSIICQTYENLEILVVDDCSTDGSIAIIEEYQSRDRRIRLMVNEQNLGLVGNWNKCISEASGEYVKLQFQDDMMLENTIEKIMDLAVDRNVDVVLTEREYIFESDDIKFNPDVLPRLSDYFKEEAITEPSFIAGLLMDIGTENFMGEPILGLVKKEVFEFLGVYDDTFRHIVDFEFWLRLGLNIKLGFTPEKLHLFRLHHGSQGAKNSREPEINPTHLDRVHLASKLALNQHYSKLRSIAGDSYPENLLQSNLRFCSNLYGYKRLSKHLGKEYAQFFRRPLLSRLFDVFKRRKKKLSL